MYQLSPVISIKKQITCLQRDDSKVHSEEFIRSWNQSYTYNTNDYNYAHYASHKAVHRTPLLIYIIHLRGLYQIIIMESITQWRVIQLLIVSNWRLQLLQLLILFIFNRTYSKVAVVYYFTLWVGYLLLQCINASNAIAKIRRTLNKINRRFNKWKQQN